MTSVVGFVPVAMYGLAGDAHEWAAGLRREAGEVDAALARLRSSSSEFVPRLPDHPSSIEELAERVALLGEAVAALGEAAEQADRDGVGLHEVMAGVVGGLGTLDRAVGGAAALLHLERVSVHSGRALRGGLTLRRLARRWGPDGMPEIARVRASMAGGDRLPRAHVRIEVRRLYQEIKDVRRAATSTRADALHALRWNTPLTRQGRQVREFLTTTRPGRALRGAGKGLGGAGVAIGAYDTVQSWREDDVEGVVTSGISTAGGALMLTANPVLVAAGATLVVGALIYEHREAIRDGLNEAADEVAEAGRQLRQGGQDVVRGASRILEGLF